MGELLGQRSSGSKGLTHMSSKRPRKVEAQGCAIEIILEIPMATMAMGVEVRWTSR